MLNDICLVYQQLQMLIHDAQEMIYQSYMQGEKISSEKKADGSDVTSVDLAASEMAAKYLDNLPAGWIVLDEEAAPPTPDDMANANFLVTYDPMDGSVLMKNGILEGVTTMAAIWQKNKVGNFECIASVAMRPFMKDKLKWCKGIKPATYTYLGVDRILETTPPNADFMLLDYHWAEHFGWKHTCRPLIQVGPSGQNMFNLAKGTAMGMVFEAKWWDAALLGVAESIGYRAFILEDGGRGNYITHATKSLGISGDIFYHNGKFSNAKSPILIVHPEHFSEVMQHLYPLS